MNCFSEAVHQELRDVCCGWAVSGQSQVSVRARASVLVGRFGLSEPPSNSRIRNSTSCSCCRVLLGIAHSLVQSRFVHFGEIGRCRATFGLDPVRGWFRAWRNNCSKCSAGKTNYQELWCLSRIIENCEKFVVVEQFLDKFHYSRVVFRETHDILTALCCTA